MVQIMMLQFGEQCLVNQKATVTVHCNKSVGHRHCFKYLTCWAIKQENHKRKGHVIAYLKKKHVQNVMRLKISMPTRDADLK